MNSFIPIANFHSNVVSFQKPELTIILSLYGRMVASGASGAIMEFPH